VSALFRTAHCWDSGRTAATARPSTSSQSAWTTWPFGVDSIEELSAWEQRFAELDVPYSPPADAGPFGRTINFKDPDGITLEIFVPAGRMGA
jgi:hypothetical protein